MCRLLSGIAIAQRTTSVTALASQPAGDPRVFDEDMICSESVNQQIKIQPAATTAIPGIAMGINDPSIPAQLAQCGDADDVHLIMVFLRNVAPCPLHLLRKAVQL